MPGLFRTIQGLVRLISIRRRNARRAALFAAARLASKEVIRRRGNHPQVCVPFQRVACGGLPPPLALAPAICYPACMRPFLTPVPCPEALEGLPHSRIIPFAPFPIRLPKRITFRPPVPPSGRAITHKSAIRFRFVLQKNFFGILCLARHLLAQHGTTWHIRLP